MFNIIALFNAERNTTYWIKAKETHNYASAPLVTRALIF
jgi:hypothetical protein